MKKKVIVLMMCAVLCIGITACGKKTKDTSTEPTIELTEEITKNPEPTTKDKITKEPEPTTKDEITKQPEPTTKNEITKQPEPTTKDEITKQPKPTKAEEISITPEAKDKLKESNSSTTQASGIIDGKNYSSEEFKFSITVPENYVILDETTSLNLLYDSVKLMYDSVDSMMNALDTMGIKYLFVATTTEPLNVNTTANIIAQVYPTSLLPGTLEEILQAIMDDSSQPLKELGAEFEMSEPEIQKINDNNIGIAKSKILLNGEFGGRTYDNATMYQQYICFENGDNRIMLSVTYYTQEEEKKIEDMIQTIKITK